MTTWDPEQYLQFAALRLRPALDLLAHVELAAPGLIVDLGCGPGNLTTALAERWPEAEVIGVDSSPAMLADARRDHPDLTWVEADLAGWEPPRPADLVFSNAALHWLPDHATLLPSLFGRVAPGGVLAVQVPDEWDAPSHTAGFEIANSPRWTDRLGYDLSEHPLLDGQGYLDVLLPLAASVDCWTTRYFHVLEGADPVVEWYRGSFLRAFLSLLDEADGEAFVAEYAAAMREAYPPRADGRTVLPFQRLFLVARAP